MQDVPEIEDGEIIDEDHKRKRTRNIIIIVVVAMVLLCFCCTFFGIIFAVLGGATDGIMQGLSAVVDPIFSSPLI